jgi:UDP-glucose 4-epimerase
MNCVVIGGQGFLGRAVVNRLIDEGNDVMVADRLLGHDITNFASMKELLRGRDEVYHMAGILGTSEMNKDMRTSIEVNVLGTLNVLEACRQGGVKRLFYPSKPNVWLNTYSATKQAAEDFAQIYNKQTDLQVISLRYFNAYGAGQHTHPVRKIIPTFAIEAFFKKPLQVYGNGVNVVDMVDARDIADYTVAATHAGLNDQIYELGTGYARTVHSVAFDVLSVTGHNSHIEYVPMREGEVEPTILVAHVQPLLAKLNMWEFREWHETLEEAIDYFYNLPAEHLELAYESLHNDSRKNWEAAYFSQPTEGAA